MYEDMKNGYGKPFADINKGCPNGEYKTVDSSQSTLKNIELGIDIIYLIEILFCFVKRTMAHKDIKSIAMNYLSFYFWFDVIGTVPCLFFFGENLAYYPLKLFRFVHVYRLNTPPKMLMGVLLAKYSKKR